MSSMKSSVSSTDCRFGRLAFRLQPEQDQREDRRDHVEAAVDRVGHLALAIPGRDRARRRRSRRRAAAAPRARSVRRRVRDRKDKASLLGLGRVLAPFSDVHIGGPSPAARRAPALSLAPAGFRSFSNMIRFGTTRGFAARLAARRCDRRLHHDPDHQGYLVDETLVAAIQPGVDNREFGDEHARPADLRRPVRPARLVLCLARHHAISPSTCRGRTQQTVLHVRFDEAGNVASVERTGIEQVASTSTRAATRRRPWAATAACFEELFGNIGAVGQRGQGAPTADNPATRRLPRCRTCNAVG